MSKEATFAIGKATETFLERCVWEAARVTHREGRKTISFKDVVNSMRQHPIPEALQFFVEEFQPEPPKMEPKAKGKAGTKRKSGTAATSKSGAAATSKSGAAATSKSSAAATSKAADEPAVEPAASGRAAKKQKVTGAKAASEQKVTGAKAASVPSSKGAGSEEPVSKALASTSSRRSSRLSS